MSENFELRDRSSAHRSSGILLHISSLPSPHGIGDLGPGARRFLDFLQEAEQSWWQVLPLHPTGFGFSPYQALSAFAGNPLFISLPELVAQGLLEESDLAERPALSADRVDFEAVEQFKTSRLRLAFQRLQEQDPDRLQARVASFLERHGFWAGDYAAFMALRSAHQGTPWNGWPAELALREDGAVGRWAEEHVSEILYRHFEQSLFFEQWEALRRDAEGRGIRFFGDVPIFAAHDSADVWADSSLFDLNEDGSPRVVAGVPPDYFSPTGQLWGNPLYRWEAHRGQDFQWWIERLRSESRLLDLLRLDHFRGFESYWEVPAGRPDAMVGTWCDGPRMEFFEAVREHLPDIGLVAENLGFITPEVERLRRQSGLPGMAVLQFAFSDGPEHPFLPHNLEPETIAYTGTHDNDTTAGWWAKPASRGGLSQEQRDFAARYLGIADRVPRPPRDAQSAALRPEARTGGDFGPRAELGRLSPRDVSAACIRALSSSPARLVILPLQDVLGLGSEARMNLPGTGLGNWTWRVDESLLTAETARHLGEVSRLFGRSHPLGRAAPRRSNEGE